MCLLLCSFGAFLDSFCGKGSGSILLQMTNTGRDLIDTCQLIPTPLHEWIEIRLEGKTDFEILGMLWVAFFVG